jgi:hypothetical protein
VDLKAAEVSYVKSLALHSLLDVPIKLYGAYTVVGVITNEHLGYKRSWTKDEQEFVGTCMNNIGLYYNLLI